MNDEFKKRWDAAIAVLAALVVEEMGASAQDMNKENDEEGREKQYTAEELLENYEESEMEDPFEINKDVIAAAHKILKTPVVVRSREENFELGHELHVRTFGVSVHKNGLMWNLAWSIFNHDAVPNTPEVACQFINDIVWAGTPPTGPMS